MIVQKVLILGAGITGSSIANLVKNNLKEISFKIFDKGNRPGGRFSTTVSHQNKIQSLDLGYKYISSTINIDSPFSGELSNEEDFSSFSYKHLVDADLIQETNKIKDSEKDRIEYISNRGFQSLVEYILEDIKVETDFKVNSISKRKSNEFEQSKLSWQVEIENGHLEYVDCIVSTLPLPQLLELKGDFIDTLKNDSRYSALCNVEYISNWALGLFFEEKNWLSSLKSTQWRGMHLSNKDNTLDWISVNPHMQSIVVHANPEWSEEHEQLDKFDIERKILTKLHHHLPELKDMNPSGTILKKWKYSQPKESTLEGVFDSNALLFQTADKLPFIVAGDGICGSGYENCLKSAYTSFKYLKQLSKYQ